MSLDKTYAKELFKQKIMKQIQDKNSDLYYLLRVPHFPALLKQNVLLLNPLYDLNIFLNLIPVHNVYQIDFREGPIDYSFYNRNKILNLMGPQIVDIFCEVIEIKQNLAIFKLNHFRLSNVDSEIKAVLLDTKSVSYNIVTGEWALNLKEFENALLFIRYLEDIKRQNSEMYHQYRVTPDICKHILNSGCVIGRSLQVVRFKNVIKAAVDIPIGFWALKDIVENLFYNRWI